MRKNTIEKLNQLLKEYDRNVNDLEKLFDKILIILISVLVFAIIGYLIGMII